MAAPLRSSSKFFFFFIFSSALLHIGYTISTRAKQTNLILYDHETYAGCDATATIVAGKNGPAISNALEFGTILVGDNVVTEGTARESKEIGRLQGFGMNSQLDGKALYTAFSVIFTDGEFKGSTLQIQGYDNLLLNHRELGVVSGTGYFRFAIGHAILETVDMDLVNMRALFKFNVTVNHY